MREIVRQRFATGGWTATPILWDGFNQALSEPTPSGGYFRPRLEEGTPEFVGIGGDVCRQRWPCVLVTDRFAPVATGDDVAAQDVDALLARFRRFESGGVVFHRPGFCKDLQSEDGVRHVLRVFQPFYYEETV